MNRKSQSAEEKARDAFVEFLETNARAPLGVFLKSLFQPKKIPRQFTELQKLRIKTEVNCYGSRADIVIFSETAVVCIEVKINAVEQIGQYNKYKCYFEEQGLDVFTFGLLNRISARSKNNEAFLGKTGRVLWAKILEAFGMQFAEDSNFRKLVKELESFGVATDLIAKEGKWQKIQKDVSLIATDNNVLHLFLKDFMRQISGFDAEPWQAGNAPYSYLIGRQNWKQVFNEKNYRRVVLSLNKPTRAHSFEEPNFAFGLFLWHTDWFRNREWFSINRAKIVSHFKARGFRIVRNQPGKWRDEPMEWNSPYPNESLKYVNAFWNFRLHESKYRSMSWQQIIDTLQKEFLKIAAHVDDLKNKL